MNENDQMKVEVTGTSVFSKTEMGLNWNVERMISFKDKLLGSRA